MNKRILKELAPHLESMEIIYKNLVVTLTADGEDLDLAERCASLGAVCFGLSMARGTREVSEETDSVIYAQSMFRALMSLKKLQELGYVEGRFEGEDEYGFPAFFVGEVHKIPDDEWEGSDDNA